MARRVGVRGGPLREAGRTSGARGRLLGAWFLRSMATARDCSRLAAQASRNGDRGEASQLDWPRTLCRADRLARGAGTGAVWRCTTRRTPDGILARAHGARIFHAACECAQRDEAGSRHLRLFAVDREELGEYVDDIGRGKDDGHHVIVTADVTQHAHLRRRSRGQKRRTAQRAREHASVAPHRRAACSGRALVARVRSVRPHAARARAASMARGAGACACARDAPRGWRRARAAPSGCTCGRA